MEKKVRTRHHILFPEAAWQRAAPIGTTLRDGFVVKINKVLHRTLHDEVDRALPKYNATAKLPKQSTIKYL